MMRKTLIAVRLILAGFIIGYHAIDDVIAQDPVTLANVSEILARPDSAYVYALDSAAGELLEINVDTTTISRRLDVGSKPADFDIEPTGSFAFVINPGDASLIRVDLARFTVETTRMLDAIDPSNGPPRQATAASADQVAVIYERLGTLVVYEFESGTTSEPLRVAIDEADLGFHDLIFHTESSTYIGVTNTSQNRSNPGFLNTDDRLVRLKVTNGTPVIEAFSPEPLNIQIWNHRFLLSGDRSSIVLGRWPVDIATLSLGNPVSSRGLLGLSATGEAGVVVDAITDLPVGSTLMELSQATHAVSQTEGNRLVIALQGRDKLKIVDVDHLLTYFPPDGTTAPFLGTRLRFPGEGVLHEVFVGTDRASVESATTNSPEFLGTSSAGTYDVGPFEHGKDYFWKSVSVDALDLPVRAMRFTAGLRTTRTEFAPAFGDNDILSDVEITPEYSAHTIDIGPEGGQFFSEGAVIFEEHGDKWKRVQRLGAEEQVGDATIAIHGDRAIFGGPGANIAGGQSGVAYMYERRGNGQWELTDTITPETSMPGGRFGASVAMFGDYCVIAAPTSATYVFRRESAAGKWRQTARFEIPENAGADRSFLAMEVAIHGNLIAVGYPGASGMAGQVAIYQRQYGTENWSVLQSLVSGSEGQTRREFGRSVDLDGRTVVVGGSQSSSVDEGGFFVFERASSSEPFERSASFLIPERQSSGNSVSVDHDIIVVGSLRGPARFLQKGANGEWSERFQFEGDPVSLQQVATSSGKLVGSTPWYDEEVPAVGVGKATWYEYDMLREASVEFAGVPSNQITVNSEYVYAGRLTRPATVTARALPLFLKLESDGTLDFKITGTPGEEHIGTHVIDLVIEGKRGIEALQSIELTVAPLPEKPEFAVQPSSISVSEGLRARFEVSVTGGGELTYQWFASGVEVEGAKEPLLDVRVGLGDAGNYTVVARNGAGQTQSSPAVLTVLPKTRTGGTWSSGGNGSARTSYYPAHYAGLPFRKIWTASSRDAALSPIVAQGSVFVSQGYFSGGISPLSAFDLHTGELQWRTTLRAASPAFFHEGRLFAKEELENADGRTGRVSAIDSSSGDLLWRADIDRIRQLGVSPIVAGGNVWTDLDAGVISFDFATGNQGPRISGRRDRTQLSSDGSRLFRTTQGQLHAHAADSGALLWSIHLPGNSFRSQIPVVSDGVVIVNSLRLVAYEAETGKELWSTLAAAGGVLPAPAIADGAIYVPTIDQGITAYDLYTGKAVAHGDLPAPPVLEPSAQLGQMIVCNDLVFLSYNDRVLVLDRLTLEMVQEIPHGGFLALSDGFLIVAEHRLMEANGKVEGLIHAYSVAPPSNLTVTGASEAFAGVPFAATVAANEDGSDSRQIRFRTNNLPGWAVLTDNFDGTATISGTPSESTVNSPQTFTVSALLPSGFQAQTSIRVDVKASPAPVIRYVSGDQSLQEGMQLRLQSVVEGAGDVSFQWIRNGSSLDGQAAPVLLIENVNDSHSGSYFLRATNVLGSIDSDLVRVDVLPPARDAGDWSTLAANAQRSGYYPATFGGTFTPDFTLAVEEGARLNPVTVSDNRLIVTSDPRTGQSRAPSVKAFDAERGFAVWTHELAASEVSFSVTTPTIHRDSIYIGQNESSRSFLRVLAQGSGRSKGTVRYGDQWFRYVAPAAIDDRLYFFGGESGLLSVDLDTNRIRFQGRDETHDDVPSISLSTEGRVFLQRPSAFAEHDRNTGDELWKIETAPGATQFEDEPVSTAAITGTFAIVIGNQELLVIDTIERKIVTRIAGEFSGSPGVANDIIYVIRRDSVVAFELLTGHEILEFKSDSPLQIQPTIAADLIAAASENKVFIFHRWTGDLVQILEAGGQVTLWNGRLYAANRDGTVHAFTINRPPTFVTLELQGATEDQLYEATIEASDPDGEPVLFEISELPAWLNTLPPTEQADAGLLLLQGTPLQQDTGMSRITISVQDPNGAQTTQVYEFAVQEVNDPPVVMRIEQTIEEDAPSFSVNLLDSSEDEEDGKALTFEISEPASNVTKTAVVNGSTVTISLNPDAFGSAEIHFDAIDTGGARSPGSIILEVTPVPDAPRFLSFPPVNAGPAAADQTLSIAAAFFDPDPDDSLIFELAGGTNREIFSLLDLNANSGQLTIRFAPYLDGESVEGIRATDSTGRSVEFDLAVLLPPIPAPAVTSSELTLNRQTGLFEQVLAITNVGQRPLGSALLQIQGLDDGVTVYNRANFDSQGVPKIAFTSPIAPDGTGELVVEYFAPGRKMSPPNTISAEAVQPFAPQPLREPQFAIDRALLRENGSILIEFTSVAGARYQVEYLDEGDDQWIASPSAFTATANRTQWIDAGPPKTLRRPEDVPARLYRIVEWRE